MNNDLKFSIIKRLSDRCELPTALKILGLNKNMCELGVQKGSFLWQMISLGEPEYVVGIDVWDNKLSPYWTQEEHDKCYNHVLQFKEWIPQKFRHLTSEVCDINIIKGDHSVLHEDFSQNQFDFVYIDSEHTYEATKRDIEQWWPKVKPGGILAGHDYKHRSGVNKMTGEAWKWGVVEAVDEFRAKHDIKYFHLTKESNKSWIFIKEE